ncbi:MAG: glycoside hydrolase family 13 protein, partial [Bacteroidota bacterium]
GFYFHAQHRRYGGDLQGVLDKLDYLKELGITAIYFNPLFESPSLHKYDAASFHHIDDNFGPDPSGDKTIADQEDPADPATWKWTSADRLFLKMIKEAHQRGIRIVIDGVFNHVGLNFWAFRNVIKHQESSLYKDWFTIHRWDDPSTSENEFDYEGWAGVKELPEIREENNGLVEPFARHVFHVVKRWMDPNGDGDPSVGIDGWRLDVAEKVGVPFWRKFRQWVKGVNPEAYLVGEVWWEDWRADKIFNAAPWLQGDVFDAVMNYRWAKEAFLFFAAREKGITSAEFSRRIGSLLSDYPAEVNLVLLNLYSSHDTDRFSSHILNADLSYDHRVGLSDNRGYKAEKPGEDELDTKRLMILFQMTFPGAPTVYYGSESGMWGGDDPDCRKPMLWDDMQFAPESNHPFGKARRVDENRFDREMYEFYRTTIGLRRSNPELSLGTLRMIPTGSPDVVAFERSLGQWTSTVVLNKASSPREVVISRKGGFERWRTLFGKNPERRGSDLIFSLSPRNGSVIRTEVGP